MHSVVAVKEEKEKHRDKNRKTTALLYKFRFYFILQYFGLQRRYYGMVDISSTMS